MRAAPIVESLWEVVFILVFLVVSVILAIVASHRIKGSTEAFYVGRRALPLWLSALTLSAQSLDSGATIGNWTYVYSEGFWLGFSIPLGLSISLFLTGTLFAKRLHSMRLATLPEFYLKRYNKWVELAASICMVFSFTMLLAANLAGIGQIFQFTFGLDFRIGVALICIYVTLYTMTGGLLSVAWTDAIQITLVVVGILSGFIATLVYYGDEVKIGLDQTFSMGQWVHKEEGALVFWATIAALGLGDIVALDFMERVFSVKSEQAARQACLIASFTTICIGLSISIMAACSTQFYDESDPSFLLMEFVRYELPRPISVLIFIGVVGASVSTADGAILSVSTVISNNILQRHMARGFRCVRLLTLTRIVTIPVGLMGLMFAIVLPDPGMLLILAFDIVLAGCFWPLALGTYWKRLSSVAALSSVLICSSLRVILHFTIPETHVGAETLIPAAISLAIVLGVSAVYPEEDQDVIENMMNPDGRDMDELETARDAGKFQIAPMELSGVKESSSEEGDSHAEVGFDDTNVAKDY